MISNNWSSAHGLCILAGYLNLKCGRVKVGQPVRKFTERHLDNLKKNEDEDEDEDKDEDEDEDGDEDEDDKWNNVNKIINMVRDK